MSGRVAFTAEFWGDSAVICRATDDQPGPAVVQEFGEFESWTQAQTFAQHLNQGWISRFPRFCKSSQVPFSPLILCFAISTLSRRLPLPPSSIPITLPFSSNSP